jgi:gliding motility-associated lipoprotein GldH
MVHKQPETTFHCLLTRNTSFYVVVFLLAGIMFTSCDSKNSYDTSQKIKDSQWNRQNKLTFETKISDSLSLFDFYINVRNTTDYKFSNLFLFITTFSPGPMKARDTVECTLAGPDGKWRGSGFGKIKENRILLKKGMHFPRTGTYRFEIEQGMRTEELQGVSDIGIRIEKQ